MQAGTHAKVGWTPPAEPKAEANKAVKAASAAQDALNSRNQIVALAQAETAVRLDPSQPVLRALLGRAYMANGRFGSAETAFGDALSLDATMDRVTVIKALAELGQGKTDAALATLAAIPADRADAEAGLALMLAGQHEAGLRMLDTAARAPGADARARQNLALGFALLGRWDDAAATAALDIPADQVSDRLQRWAQIAGSGANPAQQVAMLLGVAAVSDPGMPTALALAPVLPVEAAPVVAPVAIAEVAPAPAPVPVAAPEPVVVAAAEPVAPVAPIAPVVEAPAAPIMQVSAVAAVEPAAPSRLVAPRISHKSVWGIAPKPAVAVQPVIKPLSQAIVKPAAKAQLVRTGGFVVQIGAFASAQRTQVAWGRMNGKAGFLAGYTPTGSNLQVGKATLYRLAVSGIATRAEASKLCGQIKARGGDCFVRAAANDRPLEWALRRQEDGKA